MNTKCCFATGVAMTIAFGASAASANTGKVVPFELPNSAPVEQLQVDGYETVSPILVKIRYPIGFTEGTQAALFERMKAAFKSGRAGETTQDDLKDTVLGTMITNTIYHAFELHDAVASRLPEGSVILSPQKIDHVDGRFVMTPVIPNGAPPALVDLRFFVVTDPHRERVLDSDYLTFADAVTPSILITEGLPGLNSEKPVLLHTEFRQVCNPSNDKLPFLECISPRLAAIAPTAGDKIWSKAWKRARVKADAFRLDFPIVKTPISQSNETGEVMEGDEYKVDPQLVRGSFQRAFDNLGNAVARYASDNWSSLIPQQKDAYFSQYAGILLSTDMQISGSENAAALNILSENLRIEKEVLALISDNLRSSTYDGEYGDALRQTLALEAQIFEKRRDIAKSQRTGMFVGLVLGAAVSASGDQSLMNTYMTTMNNVAQASQAEGDRSRELMQSFNSRFSEAYSEQLNFSENVVLTDTELTASNYSELRSQLAALVGL